MWSIKWSLVSRDPNTLRAQYLEKGWIETPFQRTTYRKWHIDYQIHCSHVTDDVT